MVRFSIKMENTIREASTGIIGDSDRDTSSVKNEEFMCIKQEVEESSLTEDQILERMLFYADNETCVKNEVTFNDDESKQTLHEKLRQSESLQVSARDENNTVPDEFSFVKGESKQINSSRKKARRKSKSSAYNPRDVILNKCIRYCPKCERRSRSERSSRDNECRSCGTKRSYQCRLCQREGFTSYARFHYHLRSRCEPTHHYRCDECEYSTNFRYMIVTHLSRGHDADETNGGKRRVRARTRSLRASREANRGNKVVKHVAEVEEEAMTGDDRLYSRGNNKYVKRYCTKCEQSAGNSVAFSGRQICKRCRGPMQWQCLKCDKRYDKYTSVRNHVTLGCFVKRLFKCSECDYETASSFHVNRHYKRKHDDTAKYECSKCGSTFKDNSYLNYHKKYCDKTPNLKCRLCSYVSLQKWKLCHHLEDEHGVDSDEVDEYIVDDGATQCA